MSAIADLSSPTPPRKQRGKPSRGKEHSKSLQYNVGDVVLAPKADRKHNQNQNRSHDKALPRDDLVSPLTPPRTSSQLVGVTLDANVGSVPSKKKNGRGRKKTNAKADGADHVATASLPHAAGPHTEPPAPSATPLKQNTQMYAGPTFHASPAPSSLPIPKFLAKSASLGDQLPTVHSLSLDEDSSQESSSGNGGESPTLRSSLRAEGSQIREPSPLDIFFKADREEKARLSQNSPQAAIQGADRAKSASPSIQSFKQGEVRQHARRQTESPFTSSRPGSEDIQAKTEALKQLLLFPKGQQPSPARPNSNFSPLSHFHRASSQQAASGLATPSRLFPKDPTRSESSLHDSPSIPASAPRAPQTRRPLPSHVRQDLLSKLPLDHTERSSEPTFVAPVMP